jgi:hypothetical protein
MGHELLLDDAQRGRLRDLLRAVVLRQLSEERDRIEKARRTSSPGRRRSRGTPREVGSAGRLPPPYHGETT